MSHTEAKYILIIDEKRNVEISSETTVQEIVEKYMSFSELSAKHVDLYAIKIGTYVSKGSVN